MNVPTIEMISDFVKAMPVLGNGEVVFESGPNPYDTRSFHPLYDSKLGFNSQAYERFEHERDNWNVLGLVNTEEALGLKKWLKEEAVLWSVGLCLPGSTRHNPTLGPLVFDKEFKRRLLNYLERFLRNADADELSPEQWIGYAKANGGYEFAQGLMISNPQFLALWDIAESTGSRPSVEQIVGEGQAPTIEVEEVPDTGKQSNYPSIPGKLPPVACGRLAIKAAWQFECKTGYRASAKEVMAILGEWAKSGQEPDVLRRSLGRDDVEWLAKGIPKPYSLEACKKTLAKWHASRQ